MKIGVNLKIDVTKLDKSRFFQGQKGTYVDVTAFIDIDQEDQYGNAGFLTQSMSADERAAGFQMPIIGNSKIFYKDNQQQPAQAPPQNPQQPRPQAPQQQPPQQYAQAPVQQPPQQYAQAPVQQAPQQVAPSPASSEFEDDIPF